MAYVDLNTIHNPATGTSPPASWGDQVRDNLEWFADPPMCSVYHDTTQTLTTGSQSKMSANEEYFDNANLHSKLTNNTRITIGTAGRYILVATVIFAANATGLRAVRFIINNSVVLQGMKVPAVTDGSENTLVTAVRFYTLAANDYVEVQARQLSGGALNAQLDEFGVTWNTR